jgi:hypothetical protein
MKEPDLDLQLRFLLSTSLNKLHLGQISSSELQFEVVPCFIAHKSDDMLIYKGTRLVISVKERSLSGLTRETDYAWSLGDSR